MIFLSLANRRHIEPGGERRRLFGGSGNFEVFQFRVLNKRVVLGVDFILGLVFGPGFEGVILVLGFVHAALIVQLLLVVACVHQQILFESLSDFLVSGFF